MKLPTILTSFIFILIFYSCTKEDFSPKTSPINNEMRRGWLNFPADFREFIDNNLSESHPFHPRLSEEGIIDLYFWNGLDQLDPLDEEGFEKKVQNLVLDQRTHMVVKSSKSDNINNKGITNCDYGSCDDYLQQAINYYQQQADDSCKTVYAGIQCCDTQLGPISYLIVVEPNCLVPPSGPVSWTYSTE